MRKLQSLWAGSVKSKASNSPKIRQPFSNRNDMLELISLVLHRTKPRRIGIGRVPDESFVKFDC